MREVFFLNQTVKSEILDISEIFPLVYLISEQQAFLLQFSFPFLLYPVQPIQMNKINPRRHLVRVRSSYFSHASKELFYSLVEAFVRVTLKGAN